jgi:hypothetical protein
MKEMVDIGSHFIRFRDEAESLRGKFLVHTIPYMFLHVLYPDSFFLSEALHRAEMRANDLEKKLKASEKVHKKAEKEAAGVEDLRERLHAAENALSDRETEIAQREADVIARFETQSARFSSNTTFPFSALFTCVSMPLSYLY